MSQFLILDSLGNAVADFDDEMTARATLHAIVQVEPEAADHITLVEYDEDGMPVGEPVTAYDAPLSVALGETEFVQWGSTTAVVRRVSKAQRRYIPLGSPTWNVVRFPEDPHVQHAAN